MTTLRIVLRPPRQTGSSWCCISSLIERRQCSLAAATFSSIPSNRSTGTRSQRFRSRELCHSLDSVLPVRCLSSSNGSRNNRRRSSSTNDNPFRNTYGTPFSVAPEQAIEKFQHWATQQQGLPNWLVRNIAISAAYVPVWTLDITVRYKHQGKVVTPPSFFQPVYGTEKTTLHIPGLSAYAGYTYRRSLVDPVHNTTVLALSTVQPFSANLLQDLHFTQSSSSTIPIFLDPWNAPQGRALEVVREALMALADEPAATIATQVTQTRRVYLPTYIVQYSILGMEYVLRMMIDASSLTSFPPSRYQAFLSGCNPTTPVSGISHALWESSSPSSDSSSASIHPNTVLAAWDRAVQTVGGRNVASILALTLQWTASLLARIAARIPWIAAVGGAYVGFRKVIRPWCVVFECLC